MEESPIEKFYSSNNVFITGGTGFMGKILVEKLLRSTKAPKLFLLVRKKDEESVEQVLDAMFEDEIFSELRRSRPGFRARVHPVQGDCSVPNLGLDYKDMGRVIDNTNVVFHLAASIRFDLGLKDAYAINVNGSLEVIDMAKQMKDLKAFIYVSTAFSTVTKQTIDEKIYDFPYSLEAIASLMKELEAEDINKLTPQLLRSWPNTYTFTKALAESVIQKQANELPVAVFRPSIVMPTYQEPRSGWTDNLNGPTGILLGVISGALAVMPCNVNDNVADIVPVEFCVAGMIAAAWDISRKFSRHQESVAVYNFVNKENTITWKALLKRTIEASKKRLGHKKVWITYPFNFTMLWILMTFLHLIPAILNDVYHSVKSQKRCSFRTFKLYRRILKSYKVLHPFFSRTWVFKNENIRELWGKMDERDQQLFPLSMEVVNWETYFQRYVEGLDKKFLSRNEANIGTLPERDGNSVHFVRHIFMSMVIFFVCNSILSIAIT